MKTHFWFGQWIDDQQLDAGMAQLPEHLHATLAERFELSCLLNAANALSAELNPGQPIYEQLYEQAATTTAPEDIPAMLHALKTALQPEHLRYKLRCELGEEETGSPKRQFPNERFEAWYPVGCVVHTMPANVFLVAALGLVESLLVGNINIVKLSARDSPFAAVFAERLCSLDPSGQLEGYIAVVHLASKQRTRLQALLDQADAISAWGGEKAITAVRKMAPAGTRMIEWGHKISFGYISQGVLQSPNAYEHALTGAARDVCRLDQQACSSPQCIFVEGSHESARRFAQDLAARLDVISPQIPGQQPDQHEQAEITTQMNVALAEAGLGLTEIFTDQADDRWRVIFDRREGLVPSPLYRSIRVKPIERERIMAVLRPMRQWLQSVGLACTRAETAELARRFFSAGVTRIARPGEMVDSGMGEPHDGVYALQRFTRRVSLSPSSELTDIGSFTEFEPHDPPPLAHRPVMSKADFLAEADRHHHRRGVLFKSGGTSGNTIFSPYDWDDYNLILKNGAHALLAAGLDPQHDRAMNLFAAGHFYGGFLSIWDMCRYLGVTAFPMSLTANSNEVADMIVRARANTLLGLPSNLIALFEEQGDRIAPYIDKIFYAAEKITQAQRQYFEEQWGVTMVRSAVYGSNDTGPAGYQCTHCQGSEHHIITDNHHIEIVGLEHDQPVAPGEIGRILITPRARTFPQIYRYDLGDTARWVTEPCPCGRNEPKLELLGRTGDNFKAGGPFFNYRKFVYLLDDHCGYSGPVQIEITEEDNHTLMCCCVDSQLNHSEQALADILRTHYPEIAQGEGELGLAFRFEVRKQPAERFCYNPTSGKLTPVHDLRNG